MTALPEAFIQNMRLLLGEEQAHSLVEALDTSVSTSIRIAQGRETHFPIPSDARVVPWCPWGYYLSERPTFTGDPAFHAGHYYVQEASSMLLYQILPLLGDTPCVALDLCAAPGGKSTLLRDMLPEGSVLISNEVVRHRANVLSENIQKWGDPNCIVTSSMPERLGEIGAFVNVLVVDAPCSGEGMFRKDDTARREWRADSPRLCAERQRTILHDIWNVLLPDGLIVYSTCTFNREENEDIVHFLVEELGAVPIDLGDIAGGVMRSPYSEYPCYRMMPHHTEGEGLFMAVLRKRDADTYLAKYPKRAKAKPTTVPNDVKHWVKEPDAYAWELTDGGEVRAYPIAMLPVFDLLRDSKIPILTAGIPIALIKGKSAIPLPALACSKALAEDAFERVELAPEEVIPYLGREAITIGEDIPAGIKLMHHAGYALGFAKHLGSRANNLYPAEWRIRHGQQLMNSRES